MSMIHWGQPWKMNGAMQPFQRAYFDNVRNHGSIPVLNWCSWELGKGVYQPDFRCATSPPATTTPSSRSWATDAKAVGAPLDAALQPRDERLVVSPGARARRAPGRSSTTTAASDSSGRGAVHGIFESGWRDERVVDVVAEPTRRRPRAIRTCRSCIRATRTSTGRASASTTSRPACGFRRTRCSRARGPRWMEEQLPERAPRRAEQADGARRDRLGGSRRRRLQEGGVDPRSAAEAAADSVPADQGLHVVRLGRQRLRDVADRQLRSSAAGVQRLCRVAGVRH